MTTLAPNTPSNKASTLLDSGDGDIDLAREVLALFRSGTFDEWERTSLVTLFERVANQAHKPLLAVLAADHVAWLEEVPGSGQLRSPERPGWLAYFRSTKAFPGVEDIYFQALLAESPTAQAESARQEAEQAAFRDDFNAKEKEREAATAKAHAVRAEELHRLSIAAGGTVVRIAGNRNRKNLTLDRRVTRERRWVWGGARGGSAEFDTAEFASDASGGEIPAPRREDYGSARDVPVETLAIDWPRVRRSLELAREVFVESGDVGPDLVIAPKWLALAETAHLVRLVADVFGLQDIDVRTYMQFGGAYRATRIEPHDTVMALRAASRLLTLFDPLASSDLYETALEGARVELWTLRSELGRELPGAPRLHVHVGDVSLEGERVVERANGRPSNSGSAMATPDEVRRAAAAVLERHHTREAAAKACSVSRRDIGRWLSEDDFRMPNAQQLEALRAAGADFSSAVRVAPVTPSAAIDPSDFECSIGCECLACTLESRD